MRFRHTKEYLKKAQQNKDDMLEFIRTVLVERQSDCTSVYAPLYKTLIKAENFIKSLNEIKNNNF